MAELDDWIAPQQSTPSDGGADDWLAPAPETPSAWGDFKKQVSDYTPEGVKNLYNDVADDVGTPTLQGLSGAATTALGMPIRGVTAGQAGFGTAIDAVMNPLTLNRWGDRAERYYDPIEQRFAQENSGLMEPVNRAMEAGLSSPNGFHSAEAIGNDNLLRRSTPEEIQDFQQTAKDQQLQKAQAFASANPGKAAYSDWMQQQSRDLNPQIADQSGGERQNEPTQTPPPVGPDGLPNDWVQPSQTSNLSGFDKLREVYENNNEDQLPEKEQETPQQLYALSGTAEEKASTASKIAENFNQEQPPSQGMVRLYRVEPSKGSGRDIPDWLRQGLQAHGVDQAAGRWFATDPALLDWYERDTGPNAQLHYLDVPGGQADRFRVSNISDTIAGRTPQSFSRDPENEFFLPRDMADEKQPVPLAQAPSSEPLFARNGQQEKPTIEQRTALGAAFENSAANAEPKVVQLPGIGDVTLTASPQFEKPHGDYGRMVRIEARRTSDGAFVGHAQRIAPDEHLPNAISIGGVNVPEQFRRNGVGTALYDFAQDLASQHGASVVPSDLTTPEAKAFWANRKAQTSSEPLFALSGESQNRPRTPTEVKVYHGTTADYTTFDDMGRGAVFFADDPEYANTYAEGYTVRGDRVPGSRVIPSFIETKDFKTVDIGGNQKAWAKLESYARQAKEEGYKGVILKNVVDPDLGDNPQPHTEYMAFTPGTVRSALSDNQLYALNGFHHGPEQAVENFSQNKADAGTWKKVIEGRSGWKDYSDWTGVHDFLGDRKSISKDELLSYMRAHSADLDEKILSKSSRLNDEIGKILSPMRAWDRSPERQRLREIVNNPDNRGLDFEREFAGEGDIGELADEFKEISKKYPSLKEAINAPKAKFEGHKIPGGEPGSYRELLIRQPSLGEKQLSPEDESRLAQIKANGDAIEKEGFNKYGTFPGWPQGLRDRMAANSSLERKLLDKKVPDYISKHFNDQELAHIRFDDRVGPNGEKTLFINEIQSDLHQKGRTEGYDRGGYQEAMAAYTKMSAELRKKYAIPDNQRVENAIANGSIPITPEEKTRFEQIAEAANGTYETKNLPPNAPFKGELWLELALKRSLRYAVEHGYDAISWARSDQIAKAVGADPENLKIQYDQKIGKFLDKYTKKWGAKVERESLISRDPNEGPHAEQSGRHPNIWYAVDEHGQVLGDFSSKDEAQARVDEYLSFATNQILRITPQMRESVMGGQAYAAASRAGELLHIQRSVEGAINAGREFHNTPLTVHETHAVIRQHQSEYPNNVPVGALTSVKPVNGGKNVRFNYRSPDGREFFLDAPRSALFTGRATFDEAKSIIGLMEFGRTRSPDELSRTVGGGIRHELVHALRAADRFSVSEWGSLLDHANNLDVLGWSRYDFYRLLGDEPDVSLRRTSLRDEYLKAYAHIANEAVRSEFMDQEAVAHMVEVYHHLLKLPSDHPLRRRLMPQYRDIQPIMQSLFLGEIAKRTQAEVKRLNDNPQYALSDKERMANEPRTPTEVKVYHGTAASFDQFAPGEIHMFSDNPEVAEQYSKMPNLEAQIEREKLEPGNASKAYEGLGEGPKVIPGYIETKNFKVLDSDKEFVNWDDFYRLAEQYKSEGYPGLLVKNVHDMTPKENVYITWTPNTVRSALSDNSLYALSGGGKGAEPPSGIDIAKLRSARSKAETEYHMSPEAAMEPSPYAGFSEVAKRVPKALRDRFQVHGIITGDIEKNLVDLLDNGIDPNRPFNSGPPVGGTHGVDSTRTIAPYLIISDPGKTIPETGVKNVIVNGAAEKNIAALKAAYPNVKFMTTAQSERFMKSQGQQSASAGNGASKPPSGGGRGSPPPVSGNEPPRNSVAKESTESFSKSFGNFWKRNLQPELISDKALQADPRFAKYKAATAQEKDSIIAQGDELSRKWNKVPEKEQLAYLDAVEVGDISGLPDWQKKEAIRHRQMLNKAFQEEKDAGSKAEFVQEYMPHIWENPAKAREFFDSMLAAMPENLGPKWFQNARYYDLIKQGLDNGLKLKVTNPEELVSLRLLAGADMRQRMYLLNSLDKDYGLATKAKGRQDLVKQGWRQINAPDKTQWLLAPDAQPLWQNSVNAKGLWANESPAGTFFRGWMAFKNSFVPIKLALSLFHPLHVAHIAMSTDLARAYKELSYGNFGEAAKNVGRSVDLYNRILRGGSGRGSEARSAWLKPRDEQSPEERIVIDLMKDGGFVPQMSEQLKVSAKRNFQEAWDKSQYGRLTYLLPKHAMEKLQAPIFERWIPNLKAAAYINDAMGFAKREPDRFSDPIQRKIALRAIGKSVDNRFGEMFYGGVFWNRTFKDTAIGSFLSLGWNLGFAREFGGGVLSPVVRSLEKIRGETPSEARKTIRLAQNKTANVIAYAATAMAICGAMTYAFTGQQPTGQDFIFPRTGRKNPDGTEHRITTMFYTREVPMLLKHIQEQGGGILGTMKGTAGMLWNKLMIQPFLDMWNNRNYWGYDITDINAPAYKQGLQLGQYILKDQLSPMTMSGANHALDTGGTWTKDVPLSFLGFGPAPSYAEKTATQNRIAFLYRTHVAPSSRPQEEEEVNDAKREARTQLQVARQKGDPAAIQTAQKALQAAGGKMPKVDGDISMFKRLPVSDQSAILEWAPSDEKNRYLPYANKKIKTQFAANARQ